MSATYSNHNNIDTYSNHNNIDTKNCNNDSKIGNDISKEIDKHLGCGFYQVLHFVLFQWITILLACNMGYMVFAKVVPVWTCIRVDFINDTIPIEISYLCKESQICDQLNSGNVTFQQLNWTTDFYSIVPQFQLICAKRKLVYVAMSIQMAGVLIGSPIGGQISDWFGRKITLIISTTLLILFGSGSALAPNVEAFIALRFFVGFFCGFVIVINYIYFNEFFVAKHRLWVNSIGGWPLGFGCLALFAWITRNWRYLTLLINLNAVPCIVFHIFMKESPYWSVRKGDNAKARKSLEFVAKLNRLKPDDYNQELDHLFCDDVTEIDKFRRKRKVYGFWHLFTNRKLCFNTIVLSIAFFSTGAVAYGILFDSDNLSGNRFLNFFFISFLRIVLAIVTIVADTFIKKCGRRILFILPTSLLSLCCVVIAIMRTFEIDSYVLTVMAITSSMLTSPIWIAVCLSNAEIYPTAIRNVAYGFTQMFNRSGGVVTPMIVYLKFVWAPLPYLIFGFFALVSSILYAINIPETKGHSLPTEMPEKRKKDKIVEQETLEVNNGDDDSAS